MFNTNSNIKQYVKKPIPVQAIQWTGYNLKEVIEFTGRHPTWYEYFKTFEEYEEYVKKENGLFKIYTLEGVMNSYPGDYIIKGIHGEHYPCKKEIFEESYEEYKESPDWSAMKNSIQ